MENEVWKDVIGYESLYQVSNFGRVKNKKGKILSPYKHKSHTLYYLIIELHKDGIIKTKKLHRLVAEAFIGNIDGLEVDHIDTNTFNNCVDNLRIVTTAENNANPLSVIHRKNNKGIKRRNEIQNNLDYTLQK